VRGRRLFREWPSSTEDGFRNPPTSEVPRRTLAHIPEGAPGDGRSRKMISDQFNAALDRRNGGAIAEAVRETLRRKGLTLYRLAALSQARYPQQTANHIRRNFYSQLRAGLSPTLQQVLALSELTESRFWDWLAIFGFSLGNIPRLQAVFPRSRTGLVDKDLVDPRSPLPFLRYRHPEAVLPTTAPMSQLLEPAGFYTAGILMASARSDFVYAKIGDNDTLASGEILPGSIVRADPRLVPSWLPQQTSRRFHNLFLVEHSRGLNCGRLRITAPNHIAFVTDNPSFAGLQFRLGTEARILGVVDLELRFQLANRDRPTDVSQDSPDLGNPWNPRPIATGVGQRPGILLRTARLRADLSFRSASRLSRLIAEHLGDHRYFTSPGALSDYEAADKLPRHIHKVFSLAIIYCVAFRDLLRAFDILLGNLERIPPTRRTQGKWSSGLFENIQDQFGDVPLFLASALPTLSGLAHISLRDVFWFGGEVNPLHPSLRGAVLVLVNRRNKKPRRLSKASAGEQPVYLLEDRGGSYFAGSCGIEKGRLVLHAYPQGSPDKQAIRRHIDAEVVGQIVGIARSLVPPP